MSLSVLEIRVRANKLRISVKKSSYTIYGGASESHASLGFSGERRDVLSGSYLLGLGRRIYSPILMRFYSPDPKSPFGAGGLNLYGYCLGDPLNRIDPTGQNSRVVQASPKRSNVLHQLLGREMHGGRVSHSLKWVDHSNMSEYLLGFKKSELPSLYRYMTKEALADLFSGHLAQSGITRLDAYYYENNVKFWNRMAELLKAAGSGAVASAKAEIAQNGLKTLIALFESRLDFFDGRGLLDKNDPSHDEIVTMMNSVRVSRGD
ncbi:TPA: RHS repeat-associated core domain-containing protein [Pseudomonas putida]|nr:RHS repeat-associated core domain-containing protein [Pseudomonas putida]